MIRAQFFIEIPRHMYIAAISREYPDATFRLLSGIRTEDTAIELGEVLAETPAPIVESTRDHPAVESFELLEMTDRRALTKYETTDTDFYEAVESFELTIEFPVIVRAGWYEFDVTGTREEVERVRTYLDDWGHPYELLSLVHTNDTDSLLTERQREVLNTAIRAGYFEVPQECSLATVAAALDVDKSTVSVVLRRAEATLVKWFMNGPDDI